jgi:hypothetical protein
MSAAHLLVQCPTYLHLHRSLYIVPSLLHVERTTWRAHEGVTAAHRPGHAHAKVVGGLVLVPTSVPRERTGVLGEEAAPVTRDPRRRRLARLRRHRGAYWRFFFGIGIARIDGGTGPSNRFPRRSLQRSTVGAGSSTPAEAGDAVISPPRKCGPRGAQVTELRHRGDRLRQVATEAAGSEGPVPQRALARPIGSVTAHGGCTWWEDW